MGLCAICASHFKARLYEIYQIFFGDLFAPFSLLLKDTHLYDSKRVFYTFSILASNKTFPRNSHSKLIHSLRKTRRQGHRAVNTSCPASVRTSACIWSAPWIPKTALVERPRRSCISSAAAAVLEPSSQALEQSLPVIWQASRSGSLLVA